MAPKKKLSANGFMNFTMDWKSKYGKHMSIGEATAEAGRIWATMSVEERAPYKAKAKEEKHVAKERDIITNTGKPLSHVAKEKAELENKERQMKRDIENTVKESVNNNELEHRNYYFLSVNYFTKTYEGSTYLPAELSVCKYSLKEGIQRKYHTLINPGLGIYGYQYDAQQHAETSHKLPLPPNAIGETNLGKIYNDVLEFVYDETTGNFPPIYTHREAEQEVESVLNFLKADNGANNVDLKIYHIQHLFYIMKEAACKVGELEGPSNFFITDAFFDRDPFEHHIGLACQYHEEIDRSKYCTQSIVSRWGFAFSDYMCKDLALPIIPGRHCPPDIKLNAVITPAPCPWTDNASSISMGTASSCATKPIAGSKLYYEDQRSAISDGANKNYSNSFPALGAMKKTPKKSTSSSHRALRLAPEVLPDDDGRNLNPWTARSRNVPREPANSDFTVDFTREDSDFDEYNSMASFGRGRASLASSMFNSSNTTTGSGRGRVLRR